MRRGSEPMADRAFLNRLTAELTDQGKLIEAGWVSMRIACDLETAPPDQLHQMRMAFFAGAQHLLGAMCSFLEEGTEPTDKDMKRMDMIHKELNTFIAEFARDHIPHQGGVQ
jgi:hypothetical protein